MSIAKRLLLVLLVTSSALYCNFTQEYEKALKLDEESKGVQAAVLMIPYVSTEVFAAKLYEKVTLKRAEFYLENQEFEVAKNLLKPMLKVSPKVKTLYNEVLYAQNMNRASIELKAQKKREALDFFEKACALKYSLECLKPGMEIAHKLSDYNSSSHLSQEVYHINKSQSALLIAYDSAIKMSDEKRATFWDKLIKREKPIKVAVVVLKKEIPKEEERVELPLTRISSLTAGVKYEMSMAQNGDYDFTKVSLPIDFELYDEEDRRRYIRADVLYLNDKFYNSEDSTERTSTDTAFSMAIGVEFDYMTLEVGVTPTGVSIDPALTGLLSFRTSNESFNMNASLLRDSIDDSLLSYIGNSEPDVNEEWGRVLKNGLELGLSYDSYISYSFDLGYYPSIKGENIIDNSELKAIAQAIYHSKVGEFTQIDYGITAQYDAYDNNSHFFTYGYGGYFSPQSYLSGSAAIDITNISDKDYYWKLNASFGFESYEIEGENAYVEDALIYDFSFGVGAKFNKNLDFIFDAVFMREREYDEAALGFSFVYFFDKKDEGTLYNYHNGYRVDSRLK